MTHEASASLDPAEPVSNSANIANALFDGPPLPLSRPDPPPLPVHRLPPALRDHVLGVAGHKQVPPEFAAGLGLGAISVGTARRLKVRARDGYEEPVHLWVGLFAVPSERKSPALSDMFEPVYEWEHELQADTAHERSRRARRRSVLEKTVQKLENRAAKAFGTDEHGELMQEIHRAQEEIDRIEPTTPPRLVTDDCTPEKLLALMGENGGRMAIASSEPGVFQMVAGKYNKGQEQSETYKKAWTGEPIIDDRLGRDGARLRESALTLAVAAQPAAFKYLRNKAELRGGGTLSRFLYLMPRSLVGRRKTGADAPPPDRRAANAYRKMIRRALGLEGQHVLDLSPAARNLFDRWEGEIEPQLGPRGSLRDIGDWAGKLTGQTLRLSGLLHVAKHERPLEYAIDADTMETAVEVARAACGHAAAVFGLLDRAGHEAVDLADYVFDRIEEPMTVRDLFELTKGKAAISTVDDLREVLDLLEVHDYVRLVATERDGPGRPSERVIPNPNQISESTFAKFAKTPLEADSGNSANIANVVSENENGDVEQIERAAIRELM